MESLLEVGLSNALVAAVLALLAAVVGCACRRPALAHSLWLLVLLKLITPPLWPISLALPAAVATPVPGIPFTAPGIAGADWLAPAPPDAEAVPAEVAAQGLPLGAGEVVCEEPAGPDVLTPPLPDPAESQPAPAPTLPAPSWTWLLLAVWATGSLAWTALALWRTWRFHALLRFGRPAPAWLQAQAEELAGRLGLASCPRVWLVPGRVSPMVWAVGGAPRLFLPACLLERLDAEQRATLLVHELAHLLRRDHWVRLLELTVTALYWWHPVVWWARRALHEAEEQCCDAWVVWALPGTGRTYALALVETVDFLSEARTVLPQGASGIGHVHDLRRRITMIMRGATPRALTWGGGLAVIALGAVLLPLMPSWAQPGPEERGKIVLVEEQADPPKDGEKPRAVEVDKARADVKALEAQLEQARAQVAAAEANLRQAQQRAETVLRERVLRLKTLKGTEVVGAGQHMTLEIRDPDGQTRVIEILPGSRIILNRPAEGTGEQGRAVDPKAPLHAVPPLPTLPPRPVSPSKTPAPPAPPAPPAGARPGGAEGADRLSALEGKLKDLLREMESLRQEMRRPEKPRREEEEELRFFKPSIRAPETLPKPPATPPSIKAPEAPPTPPAPAGAN